MPGAAQEVMPTCQASNTASRQHEQQQQQPHALPCTSSPRRWCACWAPRYSPASPSQAVEAGWSPVNHKQVHRAVRWQLTASTCALIAWQRPASANAEWVSAAVHSTLPDPILDPHLHSPPTWYACTMSSISHSVPDPLRSTSSGGMGMMVDSLQSSGRSRHCFWMGWGRADKGYVVGGAEAAAASCYDT